ncbi:MAG: hypothetical protein JNK79_01590 [Chitinophagaceae bacterium]|nr:hypothetical protein [Chitinophagaceae bacterium]
MKLLFSVFLLLFATGGKDMLAGRWESRPSAKGNITGVVFKEGGILEGYINKKPFVSGTYNFNQNDSILSFVDNGCNGVEGTYKVMFFSSADSLRFRAISDSCRERLEGMERLVMGRVK